MWKNRNGGSMKINAVNILRNVTSKPELFVYLGEEMERQGFVENALDFTESLYLREEEATTGIGKGFAIPHGKSSVIEEPVVVFSHLKHGFDWPSVDGEATKNVFSLVIPKDDYQLHLSMISEIANTLNNDEFVSEINSVKTEEEIVKILGKHFEV